MDLASVAATLIGYAVIAGACVVKVPQIRLIVRSASSEGLSEALGNLARLLTTAQLLHFDAFSILSHSSTGIMNLLIVLQISHYSTSKPSVRTSGASGTAVIPLGGQDRADSKAA
eukprot:TRINITY_DN28524_c0_g1_i1.p1 TRINITY_DN28524_c0_g1~~TRINITY_DN28524_c0_g1_i1.p1  ORF type:complete len:125 (-),score=19.80 TRINITY_DN28524_c0_g1_i1:201-545(-)